MSRRWLLSVLCLSVLIALLAPLTRARGELKLNEALTRFLINKESPEALLAIENSSGETVPATIEVEILDPLDRVISRTSGVQAIGAGNQTLTVVLPHYLSKLNTAAHREILWHRLHYRLSVAGQPGVLSEGIISLSEITPDMFELRVAAAGIAKEGTRYRARVRANHPVSQKPAANVVIDAELTLEDDNKNIKLHNSKVTDGDGYALLEFQMPDRFPQFPHTLRPSGGELHVVGKRGAFVAEAQGSALVHQFTKTLVTTDKSLYQPGQVMHLRALIFTASRRALANQDIRFRIKDPEETGVFRAVAKTSRFGIAGVDWTIPENVRLGDYRILIAVDGGSDEGEESSETIYTVRISRYDLPNFSVNVQPDRPYYLPGQNAEVRVRADYLFGQPVKRGHVRVIRETQREWNYREQKWEVDEGDKHEGDTDANGIFMARLDLSSDHEEISDSTYRRFEDITYAAYFTDPTTNRTEQRRFDVRVTRDPIHIYAITDYYRSRTMPLRFYVTASYADGSPARCKINVALSNDTDDSRDKEKVITRDVVTLRTNRYGVAKARGIRVPHELENENRLRWAFSATDASGRKGKNSETLRLDNYVMPFVDTDKAIYRTGEPIVASIISSVPDEILVVDLIRDSNVIRSERLRMRNGRGSITFPYTPEFKDKLSIAAYPDFPTNYNSIDTHTVLYPENKELDLNARPSKTTYRPGDNAEVTLNVRAPKGVGTESALGVVVVDKAVEERFRTELEFSGNYYYNTADSALKSFMELDQQLGGVTLRDLQRLDKATVITPDLDLVAEVLLNQSRDYSYNFFGGDEYDSTQSHVFEKLIEKQLAPAREALAKRYQATNQYPNSEASLQSVLSEDKIDFSRVLDPWGIPYQPVFTVEGPADVLTLKTGGADKRFGTADDFVAERLRWSYFSTLGATIDRAIRQYHERTGGFIRDLTTLRTELSKAGVPLDQMRDRWGEPYRFDFTVNQSNFVLVISSSGPNKVFSQHAFYKEDDFDIWTSAIDYFAETRARIERVLAENLKTTRTFPQNEQELIDVLLNSGNSIDSLRDPWGNSYYAIFRSDLIYADRTQIDQVNVGNTRTTITPVTRKVAIATLRSIGPDGLSGTLDDFSVADFRGVMTEQTRGAAEQQPLSTQVVLSGSNGAIYGQVTDGMEASVAGVRVTVTLVLQQKTYKTSTDELGKYIINDLPPGLYQLQFEAPGFKTAVVSEVMLPVGGVVQVNAVMSPGAVAETVTVSSSGPEKFSTTSVNAASTTVEKSRLPMTKPGGPQITTPHLREYFPETLFWQPSVETDKQGRAQINFKLADNITTWKLAVVGSTEDGLVGTAETEIKSFQPFFVEHDPPRILTEGDEISLAVVVRNYLRRPQRVDLEIKPESWFSLLGPARKQTVVAAGNASRETFDFRAVTSIKDGKQRITATAVESNDAIEKPITVHPDGEELSVTDSDILGSSATLQLNVPEKMIPNSHHAELKVYPNLMAHVIESVEAIMSRPYGCGEQVISSAYPSLLLLRHHKSSGEDSALRARAERYLSLGYSSLLNYRDENGGFTYWGRGEADVALTAYALRFLTEASGLIAVDKDVIDDVQEWLLEKQQADGSWRAIDYWSSHENPRRTALLTAYVTRVLTMTKDAEPEKKADALKRALDYLGRRAVEIDEPYLLASYALAALNVRDTARAKPIIEKLVTLVHKEGGTNYWALETNTPFYGWGLAGRVETTALVIQALGRYCSDQPDKCGFDSRLINGALLFLLKQKDRYGVWYSTQATINVLDAMLSMLSTQSTDFTTAEAPAEIIVNEQLVESIRLPAGAKQLVTPITVDITKFLRTEKNTIRIKRPEGSPFASVQALASFYQPWTTAEGAANTETRANDLRLLTKCDRTQGKISEEITCHVEAERIAFKGYGMMLAEIGMPPGADVDRASLETAMNGSGWVITQYDVLPDRVVVYLWPRAGGAKFNFKFRPRFGLNAKAAASVLYDYYNPEARAVVPPATFKIQ